MKTTCHSEYGTLQSVFIKKAADAFVSQAIISQQWKELNFLGEPDFVSAQNEYVGKSSSNTRRNVFKYTVLISAPIKSRTNLLLIDTLNL